MRKNTYILYIALAGLISFAGLLLILFRMSPNGPYGFAVVLFYFTLFLSLTSFLTVLGFYFRVWLYRSEVFYSHIGIAFRQGVVLSFVAVFSLLLQSVKFLNWWTGLLLLFVAVFLEFYFSSKDSEVL